jgi:uncharacterized protein (TIGR02302 family)
MTPGTDDRRLGRRIDRTLRRAALIVTIERLWPLAWPALGVAFVFLGFAFAGVFDALPGAVHALTLAVFAMALTASVLLGVRRFKPIAAEAARRRVEHDSGLDHQPLTALSDDIAVGRDDALARALWRRSRARAAEAADRLRVAAPDPDMARRDPLALRAVAVLALAVGVGAVWSADPLDRLARALTPDLSDPSARVADVQLWITPPPYTGLPPITRTWTPPVPEVDAAPANPARTANTEPNAEPDADIRLPVGSRVLARMVGGAAPSLRIGDTETAFELLGGDGAARAFRAETTVGGPATDGTVDLGVLSDGAPVASWPVRIVGDRAPEIVFTAPPAGDGPRLRLPYEANDDYGVTGLEVVIRHADGAETADGSAEIRAPLPLGRQRGRVVAGSPIRDFSDHPWAGTQVLVRIEARDAADHVGATEDFPMVLPFRVFNHPVARALAEGRRDLVQPSPAIVDRVGDMLDDLSLRPARFYDDTVVFLGLRIARGRLRHDGSLPAIREVQDLMWQLAIRIEDGEYALAERELLDAQDRIRQAMEDGADAAAIEQMMDDLQRSLEKFLEAAQEELSKEGQDLPVDPNMEMLDADTFSDMIERARELMRLGNMDAARQMMAELSRMLQGVQSAVRGGSQMAEQMNRARQMMDGLRDLIDRQQQLLDQSFEAMRQRRGADPTPGAEAAEGGADSAEAQSALRRALGDLMLEMDDMLGGFPPQMGDAERAMQRAQGALMDGDMAGAVRNQADALSNLQGAAEGAAEQLSRQLGAMGRMTGPGQGPGPRPGQGGDPFGRGQRGFQGANVDDGSVTVPTESEIRRAQELMQELRRRAGDRFRPDFERDYIDRLLRRFR